MARWHFDQNTDEFKGDALYFIRAGKNGPVKIGRGNAANRIKTLQTGNPERLWIVGTIADVGYTEEFWHAAFATTRMAGEWFRPTRELLQAIDCALKGWDWADEATPPDDADPDYFRDQMLDAFEWYQDQIWSGKSERASAIHAVALAQIEASMTLTGAPAQ